MRCATTRGLRGSCCRRPLHPCNQQLAASLVPAHPCPHASMQPARTVSLTPKRRGGVLKAMEQLEAIQDAAQNPPPPLLSAAVLVSLLGQLEYITAAMLTSHIPREAPGAVVIQAGGGTKELYYYPKNILQVTVVGEKVNRSLMEQAGMQAGVPTLAKVQAASKLGFAAPCSVDAIVSLGAMSAAGASGAASFLAEAARVLKPGRPFIFIEKDKDMLFSSMESAQVDWDGAEFDMALSGPDTHVVGVAFKRSEQPLAPTERSAVGARSREKNRPKTGSKGFV